MSASYLAPGRPAIEGFFAAPVACRASTKRADTVRPLVTIR